MTLNGKAAALRPLTHKEAEFVQLLLSGHGKSAAYRRSYRTGADPHTVSAMAHALSKRPAVKAAVSLAESGNWGALTVCGLSSDFAMWKKFEAEANNPAIKPYVRIQAGRLARKFQADFERRTKLEGEAEEKLRAVFEQLSERNGRLRRESRLDDELTLD